MKPLKYSILVLAGLLMIASGCNKKDKDPCEDITCRNGGTCNNGACICEDDYYGPFCEVHCVHGTFKTSCECDDGYEGTDCDTEAREKFLGSFSVQEKCVTSSATYEYTSVITAGNEDARIIEISNFRGDASYNGIVATVSEGTQLTIEPQFPKGAQQVSGSGHINDTRDTIFIEYEFKASAGSNKETCNLVLY